MKAITLNICGLGNKVPYLTKYFPKVDIITLQETHTTVANCTHVSWALARKWHCIWSHGESDSRGVAILLSKVSFPLPLHSTRSDAKGRWVSTRATTQEGVLISITSVYAPNTDAECADFLSNLDLSHSDNHVIVGGDWNTVRTKEDRSPTPLTWTPTHSTHAYFKALSKYKLLDATPGGLHSCRARNSPVKSVIDRWVMSEAVAAISPTFKLIPTPWSDHDAVIIDWTKSSKKSKDLWRLDTLLLKNIRIKEDLATAYQYRSMLL
jgi:hypothetical protein